MDEAHAKEPGQHKVQNNQTTTGADLSTSTTDVPTPSSVDGLQQHVTAQNADQYFSGIGFSKDDQNGTNDDSSMQKNADSYQFNLTSPNISSNGDANQNPKPFTAESTKYGLDNITFDFNHAFSLHGSVFLGTQAGADGIGLMFQGLNQAGPGGQGSSFGLDSVNNGFGFKFDTYVNGQGYKQDGSPEQTGAFGPDPAGLNHPFGAFYYANKNWLPHPGQVTTIDQGLQTQQDIGNPDGQFHAIDFSFDGTEFVMLGFNHKWTITKQQLADLANNFSLQLVVEQVETLTYKNFDYMILQFKVKQMSM